ncbi:MAG: cytochrome b/b6 domain-containing protein [Devosiaceae bacterium]|nr:cytochrome b/b6 domain-containing protein [Devosiaceae bacterium]
MSNKKQKIRIWDLPTRIYHWLQLLVVVGALLSGFFAPEWWLGIHVWLGYGLIALLVFRIAWGFFGPEYSRFSSFIFSPKTLISHIKGIKEGKPLHFFGHNPLGALMIFALIAVLLGISLSGLINLGGVENQGALAGFVDYATGDIAGKVHLFLAFALIAMIFLHILGVVVEGKISKSNLTKSMIDGDKPLLEGEKAPILRPTLFVPAILSIAGIGLILVVGSVSMSKVPASGFIAMPISQTYQSECSDCHIIYHPSLLPKNSWAIMMDDLSEHFGEDASLDDETRDIIANYLVRYSAENWDSEAANNLLLVDKEKPIQITATAYWKLRHAKIDEEVFKSKPVRTAANCEACHSDAKTGRFADENISIPKPKKQP